MIIYKKGDLLRSSCNIIVHQVNCQGVMGSGIAKQIRDKWPEVYTDYQKFIENVYINKMAKDSEDLLGLISTSRVYDGGAVYVVNFFSQDQYLPRNICHTSTYAFRKCCEALKELIARHYVKDYCVIGFPYKIGCGLAGGDWSIISKIIEDEFQDYKVEIYMLD